MRGRMLWGRGGRAKHAHHGREGREIALSEARPGDQFTIVRIDAEPARVQALRFGMGEGARVRCVARIPAGPLVVRSGRQEIAVGRGLARRIRVRGAAG